MPSLDELVINSMSIHIFSSDFEKTWCVGMSIGYYLRQGGYV